MDTRVIIMFTTQALRHKLKYASGYHNITIQKAYRPLHGMKLIEFQEKYCIDASGHSFGKDNP
jgi:hypothetical protein